jgi:DNA-binding NarL/FixJ family response regulator
MTEEYLYEFRKAASLIDTIIKSKRERIEYWRELAKSITPQANNGGGHTGNTPKSVVETAVLNIVTIEEQIQEEINALQAKYNEIETVIASVTDSILEREILVRFYLQGETISKIACDMHFSERTISRVKDKNLKKILKLSLNVIECH